MDKKTIGIITIHNSLVSYGASLQSYALWSYLNSINYDCEIIDLYRPVMRGYINETKCLSFSTCPKNKKINYFRFIIRRIYLLFRRSYKKEINLIKKERFESFNSIAKYSKPYVSVDELYRNPPKYDIYLSGSDQIWNPDMPFENEPYLLSFVPKNKKCISYASSFGRNNIPPIYISGYKKFLKRYYAISVREDSGRKIIKKIAGENSIVALDPTMLFDCKYWKSITIKPTTKIKYLLYYTLHTNENLLLFAIKLCKKKKLALVLFSKNEYINSDITVINASDSGPKEWMGWIEFAEFVITDSFHGTVFSILFEKIFYSYIENNNSKSSRSTRIKNLLKQLSLEKCLINNQCLANYIGENHIDYLSVNSNLNNLRLLSKEYLNKVLS